MFSSGISNLSLFCLWWNTVLLLLIIICSKNLGNTVHKLALVKHTNQICIELTAGGNENVAKKYLESYKNDPPKPKNNTNEEAITKWIQAVFIDKKFKAYEETEEEKAAAAKKAREEKKKKKKMEESDDDDDDEKKKKKKKKSEKDGDGAEAADGGDDDDKKKKKKKPKDKKKKKHKKSKKPKDDKGEVAWADTELQPCDEKNHIKINGVTYKIDNPEYAFGSKSTICLTHISKHKASIYAMKHYLLVVYIFFIINIE